MDIVEWLREKAKGFFKPTSTRLNEAADEIERLRNGLEHIVEIYEHHVKTYDHVPSNLYLMAKIARAALKEKE